MVHWMPAKSLLWREGVMSSLAWGMPVQLILTSADGSLQPRDLECRPEEKSSAGRKHVWADREHVGPGPEHQVTEHLMCACVCILCVYVVCGGGVCSMYVFVHGVWAWCRGTCVCMGV